MSGFVNEENNGIFQVTSLDADTLTISPLSTLVAEAAGVSVTIELLTGAELDAGLGQPSFTVENQYLEEGFDAASKYLVYEGMTVNTLSLAIAPNAIVTGVFGLIGEEWRESGDGFSATSLADGGFEESVVEPSPNFTPMDSFTGTLTEGVDTPCVTAVELSLTRNLNPEFCIGNDKTVRVTPGRNNITGTLSAFFEDKTLVQKFLAETASSLTFTLLDPAGNQYTITLPNIKYTGADNSVTTEGAIVISMPFQALLDDVTGTNIRITR